MHSVNLKVELKNNWPFFCFIAKRMDCSRDLAAGY